MTPIKFAGLTALAAAACAALALPFVGSASLAQPVTAPAPAAVADAAPTPGKLQTAVLSGGCFWGVQGVYEHVKGVKKVYAGYAGGAAATAQYETVSTGMTGHAESVQITFDPSQISYGEVLRIFFSVATDPTQVNRQFPDEGTQYRSEIFFTTPDQQRVAMAYIRQLNAARVFQHPIATRVDPLKGFYKAEDYHQDYLVRHPDAAYIATYDLPKVAMLRQLFPAQYRPAPITVLAKS
jgi:peptide-methionine (S)-S-oxide reductase